jgi:hypothetical protein
VNLPWLRLYTEFASDPKIQILAFEDQRHYVMLLCLKGNGVLDASSVNEIYRERLIAKALGLDPVTSADAKRRLLDGGLIDSNWQPSKWDSRQFQSDSSAERVRRFRSKSKGNVTETLLKRRSNAIDSDAESDTDTDTDKKKIRGGEARAKRSPTATRLPDDFNLSPERAAYAMKQGIDPQRTFEDFRDYWKASSGQKARKHDWEATWQMWCRNQYSKSAKNSLPTKPADPDGIPSWATPEERSQILRERSANAH